MKMTKSERTRQFIIEQSLPLFNTKGVAGTSMSDIMEATKLAKGGLYGHFDSKEELSYAVVDHSLSILRQKIDSAISKFKTAKESLMAYIDFYSNPVQHKLVGGCPMLNFGMEADDTNPVIRQKIKQAIERAENRIIAMVERGISEGEFKPTWNAKEFAVRMFAIIEGGIMISRIIGDNSQMHTIIKSLKEEIEAQTI